MNWNIPGHSPTEKIIKSKQFKTMKKKQLLKNLDLATQK